MGVLDIELLDKSSGGLSLKFSNIDRSGDVNDNCTKQTFRKRKNFKRSQHHFIPRESRRSLPGRRPARRRENLQFLLSLVDGYEFDEDGNVDICDLIDKTASAFTELFLEDEKMAAWQAFACSDEDQQNEFLRSASVPQTEKRGRLNYQTIDGLPNPEPNCLKQCQCAFSKISCKLRHFLSRKHVPKGDLSKIEEDLIEFFVTTPNSIYTANLPCSFQRMLTHAVSQYLDLEAKTFNHTQGTKEIRVGSKSQGFKHPGMMLVDYLDLVKL